MAALAVRLWLTCLSLTIVCEASRADEPVYYVHIQGMNAAEALNRFAEQTGVIMLFPYDVASARQANAVSGRYTLSEALDSLLRGSGLSASVSAERVVNIVSVDDVQRAGAQEVPGSPDGCANEPQGLRARCPRTRRN